jgi:hypothetical protein
MKNSISKLNMIAKGASILALVWYGFLGYLLYLIIKALIKYIGG